MEVRGDSVAGPIVLERVLRELVGPDAILRVLCLMVIDKEFFVSIAIEIDHCDVVGAQNVCVINNLETPKLISFL